ncbi:MAG TPA: shikimate dehydrogenase [Nitrococcus sp.]|nr:shikimate dehydrogenase [Nitrococcus sp.]
MPDRYAVMGNPIAHSKSPRIHALFARETGESLVYDSILVPIDGFAAAVAEFEASGGRGLNVTVPFKQQAWYGVDRRTARAERAGAVNTIAMTPAGRLGDNTDGAGLVRDLLHNHGIELHGRRILILGAGGAVRGVLPSLLAEAPAEIVIANRTRERAEAIAAALADLGQVKACAPQRLAGDKHFDLVINGTSAGLHGEIPALPEDLRVDGATAYDMIYGEVPTAFCRWALGRGAARALDGLGMLVEQAAESFLLWRGIRPQTDAVIRMLR